MLDVLSREGRAEVVSKMVNLRDFPGVGPHVGPRRHYPVGALAVQ